VTPNQHGVEFAGATNRVMTMMMQRLLATMTVSTMLGVALAGDGPATGLLQVSSHTFRRLVLDSSMKRPMVVEFYADWCKPCHYMAPIVAMMADKYRGRIDFAQIDIDKNSILARRLHIDGVPTLVIFDRATPRGRLKGAHSRTDIESICDSYIDSSSP
jgi:putative thioredoxin